MAFALPELPYAYEGLEPYTSAKTLHLHHDKHHKAYVDKLNELIAGTEYESLSLEEIIKKSYAAGASAQPIFNNAGQHWNHTKFWEQMKPNGGGSVPGELEKRLTADFGSVDAFKAEFAKQGVAQFGSGWVWLVDAGGKLVIEKTPNAVTPIAEGKTPILICDVWEHAYYVDYENRRPEFLKVFLDSLVNWEAVAEGLIAKPV